MHAYYDDDPPFFARQVPILPMERQGEFILRKVTGLNDFFFPSTGPDAFHHGLLGGCMAFSQFAWSLYQYPPVGGIKLDKNPSSFHRSINS